MSANHSRLDPNGREMAEIRAHGTQLNALILSLFAPYNHPQIHEIGVDLRQIQLIAHDLEYYAGELYEEYATIVSDVSMQNTGSIEIPTWIQEPNG